MAIENKKKIIIIGPAYPYRGGNSLFVSFVYESLVPFYDVILLNYKLLYPSLLFPGTTQFDKSNLKLKKVPSIRIVNSISPFNWIKVAAHINKQQPDLVIFDWWHPFFALCHFSISSLLTKIVRKKVLFITENFISHEGHFIDRILTKLGLKNATHFLALSKKVENDLQSIKGNRKVFKSELPVYSLYSENKSVDIISVKKSFGFSESNKVLLFFGYVRQYKGLDILIKAMPELVKNDSEIRLLIAGEFYDSEDPYKKLINELSLHNYVVVQNKYIPNEEVKNYYLISDLVVLPYRSATQSGILNVAYGFNKPVLITNVGGLAEFVQNESTGIIVETPSPENIISGVTRFFELKSTVNFSDNIKKLAEQNSFANLTSIVNDIIEETD